MKFINYNEQVSFIIKIIKKSAMLIKKEKVRASNKGKKDIVTNIDFAIENYLIEQINKFDKSANIISEELNYNGVLKNHTYIIDPIDGTVNFALGFPLYSIQMAYYDKGDYRFSVIYFPLTKELFVAVKGEGCYLNNLKVKAVKKPIDESVLVYSLGGTVIQSQIFTSLSKEVMAVRMIGCASASFAYMVKNTFGCLVYTGQKIWDYAPGLLMLKEAKFNTFFYEGKYLIASNTAENLEILKKYMDRNFKQKD